MSRILFLVYFFIFVCMGSGPAGAADNPDIYKLRPGVARSDPKPQGADNAAVVGKQIPDARSDPKPQGADNPDIYKLRPGDTVMVSVWREEALQKQVIVLPDGSITFPLVGRVAVAGLSTPEVERLITAKLKTYLPEPVVTVLITGIDGNRAYVMGKVIHPGSLIISGPTSVLQAISIAGGFDKFADEGGIKVIREKSGGQEVFAIMYADIISGKNMSTNILLKAGDTVVVP